MNAVILANCEERSQTSKEWSYQLLPSRTFSLIPVCALQRQPVICGRDGNCDGKSEGLKSQGDLHAVRCCSPTTPEENVGTGKTPRGTPDIWVMRHGCQVFGMSPEAGCNSLKSFRQAKDICDKAGLGARLCTVTELREGCSTGTGCGQSGIRHDSELVWGSRD